MDGPSARPLAHRDLTPMTPPTASHTFAWHYASRMTGATVGGIAATYAYDGEDTRVSKSVAGTPTTYLWDRESGLPLLVDDGTDAYLHAGVLVGEVSGSTREDLLGDGLGSVRGVSGSPGTLGGSRDFDAFGAPRSTSGTTSSFAFTGEQLDAESGFTYLRARYLDPASGRFGAVDTVIPNAPGTQGFNPYAYVAGNPTTWADPSGHTIVDVTQQNGRTAASASALGLLGARLRGVFEKLACHLNPWCHKVATTIGSNQPPVNPPKTTQPPKPPQPPLPWWHPFRLPVKPGACVTTDLVLEVAQFLKDLMSASGGSFTNETLPFKSGPVVADQIGDLFVGPEKQVMVDRGTGHAVGFQDSDGSARYRYPEQKAGNRGVQANFESGAQKNIHLDVDTKCP